MVAHGQSSRFPASAWLVLRSNGAEADGTLHVKLRDERLSSQAHDGVHGIVYGDVPEWELVHVDSVIDAVSIWVG